MSKIIRRYSLCNADCKEFGHHGDYRVCDRCGAHIHKTIWELVDNNGDMVTVGSECFEKVMGYKFTVTHERAQEVADVLQENLQKYPNFTVVRPLSGRIAELNGDRGKFVRVRIPYGLSKTLIRAGMDLNLWKYSRLWPDMLELN